MDKRNVEDIYPLSSMQQGMLFHTLYAAETGVYFTQMSGKLRGEENARIFRQALQRAVDRHPMLRTSFVWDSLDEPLQIVHRRVELPVEEEDWWGLAADALEGSFESLLVADRERGFDLSAAPLMRLTLIRTGEHELRFIWSHHHILLDGWSFSTLLREILEDCEASLAGKPLQLSAVPPYREYIAWLNEQNTSSSEAFWRDSLKGFLEPSTIAHTQAANPASPSHGLFEIQLSEDATSQLSRIAKQNSLTLSSLFQGAWAIVLSRNTGKQDVVFGSVVSGRPAALAGVDSMVGLFINVIPVRENIIGQEIVIDWLRRLQQRSILSREHEHTPLMQVQTWSDIPRGSSLFDSIVVFENYPPLSNSTNNNVTDIRFFEKANYPATLIGRPGNQLSVSLNYDPRSLSETAAKRLTGQVAFVLEQIARNESQQIADLQLLTPAQTSETLRLSNQTATAYPRSRTTHEVFESQTTMHPDNIAVEFDDKCITYKQINRRANQLANLLRARLSCDGNRCIGILLNRSPEFIIAALAILKSGNAYVPLDPQYPADRLHSMLADCLAPALITAGGLSAKLSAFAGEVICLETDADKIDTQSVADLGLRVNAQDLAYVMYTSGSTGTPKGIGVTHQAINRLVLGTNYIDINSSDRIAHLSNLSFDASTFEIWGALLNGARLVGILKHVALSAAAFAKLARDGVINTVFLTTALFNRLAAEDPTVFSHLSYLLFGGEKADTRVVHRVVTSGKPKHLLHVYGPTETTTFATWHEVTAAPCDGSLVPIGRPLANSTAYVLDEVMRPVPAGIPGELYLGGDGVARGYMARSGLTAGVFVPDPFGVQPGARLYRTGDIVRYNDEGAIEFLGRKDEQVKIRGFRIEPGEIEAALSTHPSVRECIVLVREDLPGERLLVAYAACHSPGAVVSVTDLRGFLSERLPSFMIPSAFVLLPELPLNANGKIDRASLPIPDDSNTRADQPHIAPQNPVEIVVAGVCCEVLGLKRVGMSDSFFDLGGNSLSATQFVSQLREAFQTEIMLREIFERPVLSAFCQGLLQDPQRRLQVEGSAEVFLLISQMPESEASELLTTH